ncbi:unnamed protein product [Citrullus colocynthis]|uniref:RING-type domain-containing protein n=1 Tax=Citrullus colocynthis TaxID=252529 RepID=A0ABP0YSZ9_9ROSI
MPPTENRDQGETSQLGFQEAQVNPQQPVQPAMIDIEALDDDVIESSARAFAEAKNKSRRNARKNIVDVDAEERSKVSNNNRSKRRRDVSNHQPVNSDLLINLEASNSSMKVKPAPPKEPKFNCPICMGPLVEETSTRCGHIFCKACIRAAIAVQTWNEAWLTSHRILFLKTSKGNG